MVNLEDDDFKGTHYSLYGVAGEAGQHYFRWLNPADWGPFDHIQDVRGADKQADMLSFDKNADVEDHCAEDDLNGDCGHTHYLFEALDEDNDVVASELVETEGKFSADNDDYFQTVFTAGSGDLTLTVTLGRVDKGKFRAMSDTASVMFDAPDDLRALDQTYEEYLRVNNDVVGGYDENDDAERWLGEDGTGAGRSIWNNDKAGPIKDITTKQKMVAHLNNQLD